MSIAQGESYTTVELMKACTKPTWIPVALILSANWGFRSPMAVERSTKIDVSMSAPDSEPKTVHECLFRVASICAFTLEGTHSASHHSVLGFVWESQTCASGWEEAEALYIER